jgi:hypothetical protein
MPVPACDLADAPATGPRWQQTGWGRVLIGLVLSQGMFYGLRHLVTAVLLMTGRDASDVGGSAHVVLVLQTIQVIGLLVGGLLAGAGQSSGLLLGAFVGLWNGVLAVALRQIPADQWSIIGLYGQPLVHAAFGAAGGMLGQWVWRPISADALPPLLDAPRKPARRPQPGIFAGKIAWFRVVAGAAFAVAGTLCATMLFEKMLDAAAGRLGTSDEMQDRIITWEIKALAILVGGALAGASTSNGLKQGLVVGLAASVILMGIQAPFIDVSWQLPLLTLVSTLSLALVGGWFGGQLFPPIVRMDRRGRLDPSV